MAILAGLIVYFSLARVFVTVPVITAQVDIAPDTVMSPGHLQIVEVAKRDKQVGAYTSIKEIEGKSAAFQIFTGQQILEKQIKDKAEEKYLIKPQQTLITLNTQQVQWADQLKAGDLITVVGVYSETGETREEAVGRIVSNPSKAILRNLKDIQEAQATSPDQTKMSFVTDVESAKKVLLALKKADMVYLMPRHSDLGGVE
jgi:hypothetical protein